MIARRLAMLSALLTTAVVVLAFSGPANAVAASELSVTSVIPDYVTPGKLMRSAVSIQISGTDPLSGELRVAYELPPEIPPVDPSVASNISLSCQPEGSAYVCTGDASGLQPGQQIRLITYTVVNTNASGTLTGAITVSGGGAPEVAEPFSIIVGPSDPFRIKAFDIGVREASPWPVSQAGSDPAELATEVGLLSEARTNLDFPSPNLAITAPTESFRDVIAHIPPGFVGNPAATPLRCTAAQLATQAQPIQIPSCPPESQIGLVQVGAEQIVPLYNVVPPPGTPAAFGFYFENIITTLKARVRPSDNGVDIVTNRAVSSIPIPKFEVTLWGDPGNKSHDHLRGFCLNGGYGYNTGAGDCSLRAPGDVPFLRNPTSCPGTDLPWSIEMDTYQHPGSFVHKETSTDAIEGCDKVPFDPSIGLTPSDRSAGAPSGLDVELSMPQDAGITGLAEADLRSATVELPEGVAINSASADGLAACSDAQLHLGLEGPSQCPDAAKVGTLELTTPLLEDPISGSVFLRSQASKDPESGDLFRLALEIRSDERGVAIKLPGSLVVDEETGRLTTRFSDLPQLPFESMRLHLKSGPRAALTNPKKCGSYTTHAEFEGWNGKTETLDPEFTIDRNCIPSPFEPGFEAGVSDSTAGEFAPFALRVTRDSGQPNISRIDATLPEGELAKLAGVPVCSGAQANTGDCPAGSRIGQVVAGIGEGTSPLYIPQAGKAPTSVYLAGPYTGAPYSILAVVPAQAGPFDLGQVVVRSALRVDPVTTRASVLSDPLPQIFEGVPVSYRDVRVLVDRPEFTLNPTDCSAAEVTGTIAAIGGQSAAVADRFQVADCAALGFEPKLAISLGGKTRRAGNPALTAVLRIPPKGDYANIARAVVTLPGSEFIAQDHLDNICTRVQYAADGGGGAGCPKGSVYGRARAFTPLLEQPLEGPVYLRSNGGERELPDLVASLHGAIDVELVGYIDSDKRTGGLRTTFARVPDAPVSKFVLKMPGGKKSLLENSTDICRGKHRAKVKMDGQNGRIHDFQPLVKAKCGKGARKR